MGRGGGVDSGAIIICTRSSRASKSTEDLRRASTRGFGDGVIGKLRRLRLGLGLDTVGRLQTDSVSLGLMLAVGKLVSELGGSVHMELRELVTLIPSFEF